MGQLEQFDPKTRAELAGELQRRVDEPPQAWYCNRRRECDGRPHEGYNYNHARGSQWPPEGLDWVVWAAIAGRGFGKTRLATEWCRKMSETHPRIAGIGRRGFDVRATMVEGQSGLIAVCEAAKQTYLWEPSKREFTFQNGGKVHFYTAEEPDSLRGPQHHLAWLDEPAHMPLIDDVWDNLMFGLRLGTRPRVLVTTTPTPRKWMKELVKRDDTIVIRGSTFENLENLAKTFADNIVSRYDGTRLGRQELYGEIIEDVEGALWDSDMITNAHDFEETKLEGMPFTGYDGRAFERVVVAVDPAGTSTARSDETGIIVVGKVGRQFFVLEDGSGKYSPDGWAKRVVMLYRKWSADRVVAEKNYGGEMVASNLRNQDDNLPITLVTSRRGKLIRAEPIAGLYEQSRILHVGHLETLEMQELEWVPDEGPSPDRVDALVHGITDLAGSSREASIASPRGNSFTSSPVGPMGRGIYLPQGRIHTP